MEKAAATSNISADDLRESGETLLKELDRDSLIYHFIYEYHMLTSYVYDIDHLRKSYLLVLTKPRDVSILTNLLFRKFTTIQIWAMKQIAYLDAIHDENPEYLGEEGHAELQSLIDDVTGEIRYINGILRPLVKDEHSFRSLRSFASFIETCSEKMKPLSEKISYHFTRNEFYKIAGKSDVTDFSEIIASVKDISKSMQRTLDSTSVLAKDLVRLIDEEEKSA